MSRTVGRLLLPGAGLWLIGHGAALAQCAMCNTAAKSSPVGWSLSVSVLFMLTAIFLVVGWLVLLIVRTSRSGRWRDGAAAPASPLSSPLPVPGAFDRPGS
jgi:heme/copper-type cytochrome/quinol oxidase subunit 2